MMSIKLPISDLIVCPGNCSGKGDCLSGTCFCQVQYSGCSCSDRNRSYYLSFGVTFYIVCFTAIIQLILCIRSDFFKLKRPNILKACRLSIQKLLYLTIICATGSRSVYFILGLQDLVPASWKEDLYPLYYTFVLSGISLIVCFWAESFHLSGLQFDRPRFLTKSYYGFVAFNVVVYLLLITQVISNHASPKPIATKVTEIVHGCLAFLMFSSLIFFLIYGVEIFCKVEGAFKQSETSTNKRINFQQLFQSRLGLVAQASFQLAITMFLMCEVVGEMWKRKFSIGDQNIIEICFHVAELACALWFVCCLWNVSRPGDLWILNPKNLLTFSRNKEHACLVTDGKSHKNYNTFIDKPKEEVDDDQIPADPDEICPFGDCWICYDSESTDAMIQPCDCKGGMALVHHDCLKQWLLARPSTGNDKERICCSVCKAPYNVTTDQSMICIPNWIQIKAWSQTLVMVVIMTALPVMLYFVWHKVPKIHIRVIIVAVALVGEYLLLRLLGFNFLKAYRITRTRALKILGRPEKMESLPTGDSERPTHLSITVET